ncbi:hypothetical protein ACQYWQ_10680 [Streptomyces sp. P6-2-1]|uniref:hypothetical protein n=1 Tax=unclassified Streptomyces TaxID=2593676 RepID=UPI003D36D9BD
MRTHRTPDTTAQPAVPRRTARLRLALLAPLAAGAALLAAPLAHAAEGTLTINGTAFENPSGCVTLGAEPVVFRVANSTNKNAVIYAGPHCTGNVVDLVDRGAIKDVYGASLKI